MAMRVTVESMWRQCQSQRISEVAKKYGRTTQALVAEFRQSGLCGGADADPSPAAIKQACQRIRATWDEETERQRWIGARRGHFAL